MNHNLRIEHEQLEFTVSGTGRFPVLVPPAPTAPQRAVRHLQNPNVTTKRHRRNDRSTSIAGADAIAKRAGGQKRKLLEAYANAGAQGLNDYEAARLAGLERKCFWKRCGELREFGLIAEVKDANDNTVTRPGDSNVGRIVCAITKLGTDALHAVDTTI